MNRKKHFNSPCITGFNFLQQGEKKNQMQKPVRLVTLDPGIFHAALVQKQCMMMWMDSMCNHMRLQLHLDRINGYNTRTENPTHWNEDVYKGDDF